MTPRKTLGHTLDPTASHRHVAISWVAAPTGRTLYTPVSKKQVAVVLDKLTIIISMFILWVITKLNFTTLPYSLKYCIALGGGLIYILQNKLTIAVPSISSLHHTN